MKGPCSFTGTVSATISFNSLICCMIFLSLAGSASRFWSVSGQILVM